VKRKVNSISDAIDELCEYSFNLDSPIGITDETARLARIALREQAEREKGCVWCKGDWTDNFTVIDDDFGQPLTYRHVKFCPMCGRKLDGGGQDGC
jgi:hypothetical protein